MARIPRKLLKLFQGHLFSELDASQERVIQSHYLNHVVFNLEKSVFIV